MGSFSSYNPYEQLTRSSDLIAFKSFRKRDIAECNRYEYPVSPHSFIQISSDGLHYSKRVSKAIQIEVVNVVVPHP